MEIIRNFINISGLSNIDDLPKYTNGQQVQYSEIETIFIPENQPDIKSIFQILIKTKFVSKRIIPTHVGNTIVIDGIKELKIIYSQTDNTGKAIFSNIELPFNTFIEMPNDIITENISIYVLDAYFSMLDKRRIYSHFVYLLNVNFDIPEFVSNKDSIIISPNLSNP